MAEKNCPKCSGAMEEGFFPDFYEATVTVGAWYEGVPTKSFLGNVKWRGRKNYPVVAYRCSACGFLELYAPQPAAR